MGLIAVLVPNVPADRSAAAALIVAADPTVAAAMSAVAARIAPVVQIAVAVAPNGAVQVAQFYRVASALTRNPNSKAASTAVEQADYDRCVRAADRLAEPDDFREAAVLTVANRDWDSVVRNSYLRQGLTAVLHAGEQAGLTGRPACRYHRLPDSDRRYDRLVGPPAAVAVPPPRLVSALMTAFRCSWAELIRRPDRVR